MIMFDKNYHDNLDNISLDQELLRSLPQSISEVIARIEQEDDPQLRLQALCLSLIPMTFQYYALILSSEYLFSEDPPDNEVIDNLWGMIRRPGPGKWVSFIRSVTRYFSERNTRVISKEAIQAFRMTLLSDKRPRVKLHDDSRLDYYEALIDMRNRFAHSRQISKDRAEELFADYYLIWKALLSLLPKAFEPRIFLYDETGGSYHPADTREYNPLILQQLGTDTPLILLNEKTNAWMKLFPLIIAMYEPETQNGEALLLEEVKGKTLLYLFHDTVVKRKEGFSQLIQLMDARAVQVERVSSDELTVSIFGERIDRITRKTLVDFEDSLKYIPGMFVERESFSKSLDAWLDDEHPGCILVGEPGVGKTSLVADWCVKRRETGDHVLLLEASKFDHSDIPKILENILNLRSPLKECLDSVHKQNMEVSYGNKPTRFILVIDAVNEFVGKGLEHRTMLWREINSLIDRIDDYRPCFKCLVTTRSDVWGNDFPEKGSADRALKRRLFYGDDKDGFPRIELGSLTDEEAEEIYEKAQTSVPGMSPVTSFEELPQSTRRLISNPFSLRLVLHTFNDREVPALTERKLYQRFAQEKALEEKEKKDILFRLLDRMSEVKNTEISLDEFLYGKKDKSKLDKKAKNENIELERIIFNPRPSSPYKRLLAEGIIEERTVNDGEKTEERLTFSQEKITHIMDMEQKRLNRNEMKKVLVFYAAVFLIAIGFFVYKSLHCADNLQQMLSHSSLSQEQTKEVFIKASTLAKRYYNNYTLFMSIALFTCIIFVGSIFAIGKLSDNLIFKKLPKDLPFRYAVKKQSEIRRKNSKIVSRIAIVFMIYSIILIILHRFFNFILPGIIAKLFLIVFLFSFIIAIIKMVIKGFNPEMSLMRLRARKKSHNIFLVAFVVISSIYIFFSFMIFILARIDNTNPLKKDWYESTEYGVLQKNSLSSENDKVVLLEINKTLDKYLKASNNNESTTIKKEEFKIIIKDIPFINYALPIIPHKISFYSFFISFIILTSIFVIFIMYIIDKIFEILLILYLRRKKVIPVKKE